MNVLHQRLGVRCVSAEFRRSDGNVVATPDLLVKGPVAPDLCRVLVKEGVERLGGQPEKRLV